MASSWPTPPESFSRSEDEARVERWFQVTRALRALRAELEITPGQKISVAYAEGDLAGGEFVIATQAWVEKLEPTKPVGLEPTKPVGLKSVGTMAEGVDLSIPIEGLIDPTKELTRLDREQEKILADLTKLRERLDNPMFRERAKPEVVEKETALADELADKLGKIDERRRLFQD